MRVAALAALLLCLAAAVPAAAAPRLVPVGSFDQPVHLTAPPQDPQRLFVVEKPGRVKVVVDGGAPQTFLDITAEVDEQGEEGLLSIAFAPDYATSRRFYAYFTAVDASMGGGSTIKIVEFTRPEATPDSAEGAARRTLLEIPHPTASNHNGGQLQTGPDGMLWLATGDGAVSPSAAQDMNSLLGKVLRIDPRPSDTAPYSIPPGNAFPGGAGGRPEIWASGLRNPWRFSFDRQTGDFVLGDVGGGAREEIDFAPSGTGAGSNFGWPCREGRAAGPVACVAPGAVDPVFDYPHSTTTCSGVVAGFVVRDPRLPTLFGRHLYTDLCWSSPHSLLLAQPDASGDREETGLAHEGTVSFGEDSCGHVYVVSIQGPVARVEDEPFLACSAGGGMPPGGDGGGEPPPAGPSPPTPDPPAADVTPPSLGVSRARRQRLLARRFVRLAARCDEPCQLRTEANARLSIRGKLRKWAFAPTDRLAAGSVRNVLELRLTRAMRAALARRVRGGARPLVKVVLVARDAAGNETRRTLYVRVVG